MTFLTESDFIKHIGHDILNQITNEDTEPIETAETQAIGIVKDMIGGMYNLQTELQQTGADRHAPLVLWLLTLATYQLYRTIPDTEVPDRVVKDYDDTLETLRQIGRGKTPTSLQPANPETPKRVFRMGSHIKKSHNPL